MKIMAFNGSPRKHWNTGTLLNKALEGAASQGAETELVHLYDLDYRGCTSCFSCKLKGGRSYGRCALRDDLTPILKKLEEADGIILGSPIYLSEVTGMMRCFWERLIFPYLVYDKDHSSLFKGKLQTGFIYTMNVDQQGMERLGYEQKIGSSEKTAQRIFGGAAPLSLWITDTYQFDDYSKYEAALFDAQKKLRRRREVFPEDCRKAFAMGVKLAQVK